MSIDRELRSLERMSTDQLRSRYAQAWGEEPRTRHKQYLIRKIAWKLQADAEGGLAERLQRIRARATELADVAYVRSTPPRASLLPPGRQERDVGQPGADTPVLTDTRLPAVGTAITRRYKRRMIHVNVLADGFEYEGERYRSLSAVAEAITGSHCNGFRFFRLGGAQ